MSVFFTDTDCEMHYLDAENLGMHVIKMPYIVDGEEFLYDFGKETDFAAFYKKMRDGVSVSTAALNTNDYLNYFEPVLASGEDILYVHFSHNLSCTFNAMDEAIAILKEKYPERKITTFDTLSICLGAGLQAIEACKLHNNGASDEEVIEFLETFREKVVMYFYVDSLKYLRRGGRISAASAVMGSLLNIKPILAVTNEGKLEKLTTVKGNKKAIDFLVDKFNKEYLNDDKYEIFIIDADNKTAGDDLAERIRTSGKNVNVRRIDVGPVIGAHAGPGTVGVIFVKQ